MNRYSLICTFFILVCCGSVWWQGTSGFKAFTSETARRLMVLKKSRTLSDFSFENQDYKQVRFSSYQGKFILLDFIYTHCPDVCHAMGFSLKKIKEKIDASDLKEELQIINISFDTERDTPDKLGAYIKRYTTDTDSWHALRLRKPEQLQQLLIDFGVVVIPNGQGGYEHNAAVHILNRQGKLVAIHDYQADNQIIQSLREQIETSTL